MALYIPHSIFHLARLLYVRSETFGPYYVHTRWVRPRLESNPDFSVRLFPKKKKTLPELALKPWFLVITHWRLHRRDAARRNQSCGFEGGWFLRVALKNVPPWHCADAAASCGCGIRSLTLYGTFGCKRTRNFISSCRSIDTPQLTQCLRSGRSGSSRNCLRIWSSTVYNMYIHASPAEIHTGTWPAATDSLTASVIAQLYSFATLASWRFLSSKENFDVHIINWIYFIFLYFLSLKLPNSVLNSKKKASLNGVFFKVRFFMTHWSVIFYAEDAMCYRAVRKRIDCVLEMIFFLWVLKCYTSLIEVATLARPW